MNIAELHDQIELGEVGPYSAAAGASTEDLLAAIARLLVTGHVAPSGGARMLTAWKWDDEIGIADQPVLYFRDGEPFVIQGNLYPGSDVDSNAECRIYHPDTIHIEADGTTCTDRDVAMAQLKASLNAKAKQ